MIQVAQLGFGYWGTNLARVFERTRGCRLSVLSDEDPGRRAAAEEEYPGVRIVQDFDAILADADIHAVVLATPARSHFPLARRVLEAGKHCFVEKPLATATADAAMLRRLATQAGRVLMVGHTFLYSPPVIMLKELVASGALGQIYYIYSQRLNLGIVRADVNAMWNLAPHDISILLHLFEEEPAEVACAGFEFLQGSLEDVCFILLRFTSGKAAQVHVSWLDPKKVRQMTIVGSRKMVVYDDVGENKLSIFDRGYDKRIPATGMGQFSDFGEFQLVKRAGDIVVPNVATWEPLKRQADDFIQCIQKGKSPVADGNSGVAVVRVLEAAEESLRRRGAWVRPESPPAL